MASIIQAYIHFIMSLTTMAAAKVIFYLSLETCKNV